MKSRRGKAMEPDGVKICRDWRRMKSPCVNCAVPLEGRPTYENVRFIIKGCEPMEYRHTIKDGCSSPSVYSCWNKYQEWSES